MSNIFKSRIVSIENEKYSMAGGEPVSVAMHPSIQPDRPAPSMAAVSLSSSGETARRIIADAQAQARDMVAEARDKADAMTQAAYQQGKQQIMKERDAIIDQARGVLEKANGILEQAIAEREAIAVGYEEEILDLAVHIARKIIAENIEWDKAALTRIFKKAVDKVKAENEEIRVRISLSNLDAIIPDDLGVEVIPDRNLGRDECIVETENGEVNISISSQIAQISSDLRHLTV